MSGSRLECARRRRRRGCRRLWGDWRRFILSRYLNQCYQVSIHTHTYLYIYRERDIDIYIYIYIPHTPSSSLCDLLVCISLLLLSFLVHSFVVTSSSSSTPFFDASLHLTLTRHTFQERHRLSLISFFLHLPFRRLSGEEKGEE